MAAKKDLMSPGFLIGLILLSFVLGSIGNVIASRNEPRDVQKKRWLKILVYFLIVGGLSLCILYSRIGLFVLSVAIVGGGAFELVSVRRKSRYALSLPGYVSTGLIYAWLSISFLSMVWTFEVPLLLLLFFTVFAFDGFSQIFGQLFGRRLLFPKTSPQKTWEGLVGGALAAFIAGIFLGKWGQYSLNFSLVSSLIVVFTSLGGDYLASKYKRIHHVKDFSRMVPGHGGILDRFDSWLFSGAVFYGLDCFFSFFHFPL